MIRFVLWLINWNLSSIRWEMLQVEAIRLIVTSLRHKANASESLRCLASDYRGGSRRQLLHVAEALAEGDSLSRSMTRATKLFPNVFREQIARIESNEEALQIHLSQHVERYDQNATAELELQAGRGRFRQWSSFFTMVFIVTFIMLFIVPTFDRLFAEFGLALPAPTILLIRVAHLVAGYWFVALFFLINGFWLVRALESSQWFDRIVLSHWIPSRRRAIRSARLRTMASLIESGSPPTTALDMTASTLNGSTIDWQPILQAGWVTAQESHLLSQLHSRQESQWCLHRVADYLDFQNNRKQAIVKQLVQVAGSLVFGFVVATICISLYMPLVSLISGLT